MEGGLFRSHGNIDLVGEQPAEAAQEVTAAGHDYGEEVVTKEATEDEEGESVKTCTKCGDEVATVIPVAEPDGFFAKLIAIFKEFFASIAELFGMGD